MLTAFGAKRNYISKLMSNPNNPVLINNMPGATSQVNPQLNKLPGVINEASSGSIEASSPKSVDVAQTTPRATPEAKLETSESSDTSIPTARHNVNSGQAENSGNPFEPAYKRNAAAPSREKLSQLRENTLRKNEAAAGMPEEVSQHLSYLPRTEKQSPAEAASRPSNGRQGTAGKLINCCRAQSVL